MHRLKYKNAKGELLEATFMPEMGMNLISYKKESIEVIDQKTKEDFEKSFSGLGPLIGPHFHRRKPEILPKLSEEEIQKFPHIKEMKKNGSLDPFTHGISRYAPWKILDANDRLIKAVLTGKDEWKGILLSHLEGQDFKMEFEAFLDDDSLKLKLSVVSEADSIVGIHYYYTLNDGEGVVKSRVQNSYIVEEKKVPIPHGWDFDTQFQLTYPLNQDTDFTFTPYPNPLHGKILLETSKYQLQTEYFSKSQENAWQLWHPKGASFVCIEPVSAQDPRHANLTVSSIEIHLKII